jgi:hypothetical protein
VTCDCAEEQSRVRNERGRTTGSLSFFRMVSVTGDQRAVDVVFDVTSEEHGGEHREEEPYMTSLTEQFQKYWKQ